MLDISSYESHILTGYKSSLEGVMKKKYKVLIIIVVVLLLVFIAGKIIQTNIENNLKELTLIEINDVDLTNVKDGDYVGTYSAFPVSVEVKVTIENQSITNIDILKHDNGKGKDAETIIDNVINEQSIEVDLVSNATYSSKVILKAIEDALIKASN